MSLRRPDAFNRQQDFLWAAVTERDLDLVRKLVQQQCVDVNFIAPDGWVKVAGSGGKSLLHQAAWMGDLDIFKVLVEAGADVCEPRRRNWARAKGFTAFHHACFYNRVPIAEYCLAQGADPNIVGEDGFTPLHLAAKFGYDELAALLLLRGARGDIVNRNGKVPWEIAKTEELRHQLRQATIAQAAAVSDGTMETKKPTVALNRSTRPW